MKTLAQDLQGQDANTVRRVVEWLKAEGAVSAQVSLPSGRGAVVHADGTVEL